MSGDLFMGLMKLLIQILTLFTLIVTAYFVIKYWEETQEMKNEMITQNKISSQSLKSSLLPVIDVYFERVKSAPEMAQFEVQFAYDIFLENKGNAPAFDVLVQRLIVPGENKQKRAIRHTSRGKLSQFNKTVHMIGRGEKVNIHREQSDSYEYVRIKVSYWDHFRDLHKSTFEGDRDGLILKGYPILEDFHKVEGKNEDGS
ncbi:MAG: hypothetical protein ABIN18_17910 [Pseudomonadota bacterium]